MTIAKRTVTWITSQNKQVTVTIEVTRGFGVAQKDDFGDEFLVPKKVETTTIITEYDGKTYYGMTTFNPPKNGVYAAIGGTLGVTKENYERIKSAISEATREAETDVEWLNAGKSKTTTQGYSAPIKQLTRQINDLQKQLESTWSLQSMSKKYPEGLSKGQQEKELNKIRILMNEYAGTLIKLYDAKVGGKPFILEYNKLADSLNKRGFAIPRWTGQLPSDLRRLQIAYLESTIDGRNIGTYTEEQKLILFDKVIRSTKPVEDYRKVLSKDDPDKDKKINDKVNSELERFKPRFTLLTQSKTFAQLEESQQNRLNERIQNDLDESALRNRFVSADVEITDIIKSSYADGKSYSGVMKSVNDYTSKVFPDGAVIYTKKDGSTSKIDLDTYNEGWILYTDRIEGTLATVSAVERAGTDLVEYVLTGENHTDICLELSDNGRGKVYSISGLSNKYPKLTIYPPDAHFGCKSMLVPYFE